MPRRRSSVFYRRLFVALSIFGLFVLFDIALFGWLIFRSLSQRELEQVLAETELHAQELAERIGRAADEGDDLYMLMAVEGGSRIHIDSLLSGRDAVLYVLIRDRQGRRVFYDVGSNAQGEWSEPADPELPGVQGPLGSPELGAGVVAEPPDIEVPIGELGVLQIGISPAELSTRIEGLRQDLVRQASAVGGVSLLLLLTAYLAIWILLRRARRFEEQAMEAERMAYIGTLASGLAHEIRNPLNSLNLNMQLLEEEMGEAGLSSSPSGGRLLAITRTELSRLERLVTDFLSYAKPRPLELAEIAPGELLERVGEVIAADSRRRGVRLEVVDESGGARIRVDQERMKQLLLNLAQNALAATEGIDRPAVVRLTARRLGGEVALQVTDNGVGIPREEQERMFDLFYSTRKGGTGLGLAIVRRIAEAHGGRLQVDSTPGRGTNFTILLDVSSVTEEPAYEQLPALPPSQA